MLTNVPLAAAQATASQTLTSGSAGLAGGVLPVALVQPVLSVFFATAALPTAAPSDMIDQAFEPLAIDEPFLGGGRCSHPSPAPGSVDGATVQCSGELLRLARRDQPVRRGVGRIGHVDAHGAL